MKKRILSILLLCCMLLNMLPTAAFASVSDSLDNTPEENQAILEQLSALTGGSSDHAVFASDAPFAHLTAAMTSSARMTMATILVRIVLDLGVLVLMKPTPLIKMRHDFPS